jgi:hypothetical protein
MVGSTAGGGACASGTSSGATRNAAGGTPVAEFVDEVFEGVGMDAGVLLSAAGLMGGDWGECSPVIGEVAWTGTGTTAGAGAAGGEYVDVVERGGVPPGVLPETGGETGGEIGLVTPESVFAAMLDNSLACVSPKLRESDFDRSAADGWKECVRMPGL